jgi:hypothetical protein
MAICMEWDSVGPKYSNGYLTPHLLENHCRRSNIVDIHLCIFVCTAEKGSVALARCSTTHIHRFYSVVIMG